MVFEWISPVSGQSIRVSVRDISVTIAEDDSFSFDAEGRLLTAHVGANYFRRGLDGRLLRKSRAEGKRRYAWESAQGWSDLLTRLHATLDRIRAGAPAHLLPLLGRLREMDEAYYARDQIAFETVYRPIGILPPDQYLSVVLQATEGCHYNACTFCTFYRDAPFRIKSAEAFAQHVLDVKHYLGAGINLRRSVFLGDANALVHHTRHLIPFLKTINDHFPVVPRDLTGADRRAWYDAHPGGMEGIYAFIDAFTGKRKTEEEFALLADMGLRRMYIGMETGSVPLLKWLRKPSMPDDVLAVVEAAHAAGVAVAPIIMAGIGGRRFAEDHVRETCTVVNSLELRAGDLLYISDFVASPGSTYTALAATDGIAALDEHEVAAQHKALREGVRLDPGVKVATYDIREFIY